MFRKRIIALKYIIPIILFCLIGNLPAESVAKLILPKAKLKAVIVDVTVLKSSLQNQHEGFEEKQVYTENQQVSLNYRDKFFQIEFGAINCKDSNKTIFRYKLKGLDEEWIYARRNHFANYYNLAPGFYTFVVQAADKKYKWSNENGVVKISINRPFYYTWWFIAFCLTIGVLWFLWYYDSKVTRIAKQRNLLEQLVKERTDKIVSQNEEIFKQKEEAEKEKHRADTLLLNILPADTIKELKTKGKAQARSYRLATIMFTDFVGFTKVSEKLRPQELVAELDKAFSKFDEIIEKYAVEKIKTMGDAYMCAGGVPIRNKSNPFDVVLAGLEIQRHMETLKQESIALGNRYWQVRIGICTGEIVAGVIGTKRFAYDVWGDTVNIANRLETTGEAGKVNISGETFEIIKDFFDCTFRGKILAKSKGEIEMYFVDNIKRNLSLNNEGIEPNNLFKQKLNYHLYNKINYKKAEQYILDQLENGLKGTYTYHGLHHTIDVRDAVERIAAAEKVTDEDVFLLKTAALFHDSGFLWQYDDNEPIGAENAKKLLPQFGYNEAQIQIVVQLIMATQIPHIAGTQLEKIICDADLDYLGRDDFEEISFTLMNELMLVGKIKTRKDWDAIQIKFLSKHQFYTDYSIANRNEQKHKHLVVIVERFNGDLY